MTYSIEKVTTLIGARRYGDRDTNIGFLLTDSRSLCFPEETLFFALKSARNDGHNYISDLYRRGVRNFVVSAVPQNYATDYPEANFLRVINPLEALQRLAERHRDEVNIPIVGITGSNGKTMVKEWLYQVLSPDYVVTRSPRSYNSQIGVPQSVWLIDKNTEVGVFEAGISEPGEMLALRDIIQPTIAVLTNLGAAHQENFYSLEEKCREKLVLFHDAKTVVYDADDETVNGVVESFDDFKGEKLYWSRVDVKAPVAGTLLRHVAAAGSSVKKGDTVIMIESMKMELEVKAPESGTINFVVQPGTQIQAGQVLATLGGVAVAAPAPAPQAAPAAPAPAAAAPAASAGGKPVNAPVAGTLLKYAVAEGAAVKADTTIIIVESMKMELEIKAGNAGSVHFLAAAGSQISAGQAIAEIK